MGTPIDFDRYVAEHNIPEDERPEAFARLDRRADGRPTCSLIEQSEDEEQQD